MSDRTRLLRSILADRRMLVVLDNARDAEQVRPLMPGTPGCFTVVTSRNRLRGLTALNGAQTLTLGVLDPDEAEHHMSARLGDTLAATDRAALRDLVQACARLPLALVVVAGRATHQSGSLPQLVAQLRDARHRLDPFGGSDVASDLRAVLSWSYQALAEGPARLFRLIGLHPGR